MLLQRLILDEREGFNYDCMEASEFSGLASRNGRYGIAKAFVEGEIIAVPIRFHERIHGGKLHPIEVMVIGRGSSTHLCCNDLVLKVSKEAFDTHNKNIVAWLLVGDTETDSPVEDPLLIIRKDCPDAQSRINRFFKDPIAKLSGEMTTHA